MANKSLFGSTVGKLLARSNARNREAAPAYAYEPRHKLAQLAMTGTLSNTFYAQAPQPSRRGAGDGGSGRAALPGADRDLCAP